MLIAKENSDSSLEPGYTDALHILLLQPLFSLPPPPGADLILVFHFVALYSIAIDTAHQAALYVYSIQQKRFSLAVRNLQLSLLHHFASMSTSPKHNWAEDTPDIS